MKVTVLMENTALEGCGLSPEHGLSLYIEHRGKKLLLSDVPDYIEYTTSLPGFTELMDAYLRELNEAVRSALVLPSKKPFSASCNRCVHVRSLSAASTSAAVVRAPEIAALRRR